MLWTVCVVDHSCEAPAEDPRRPLCVGGDPDPHADPDLHPQSRTPPIANAPEDG